jgi:uncharacterized protein (TIGR02246 family)
MRSRPVVIPPDAPASDVEALAARVAELERSQRQEDCQGFLALFDPAATWVTGGGRRLIGREAISEFTRQVLPGAFVDGSVDYTVRVVSFISPHVALTGVDQQYVDGDNRPAGAGRPSYVWRRVDGDWLIVAGQNTAVVDSDG